MPDETADLAPRLRDVLVGVRPELDVSRHLFSGEPAYVLRDPISFQSHRLSKDAYQVLVAIDDRRTLGEIFSQLVAAGQLDEDQEEEFYRLVLSLAQRGVLSFPLSDGARLYQRFQQRRQASRKGMLMQALFLRVPLLQPDQFLDRTIDLVKPLFTRTAVALWTVAAASSLLVVASRWEEATSPLASILAVSNLPLLWTLLVGLKVIHEFGHAYACKRFGGVVAEMGAYFILFTPCAYVDASSSWGFSSRWHRIAVALAGMYFESMAAMCALLVWVVTPAGAIHDAAYYAMVLSTVVTIAFNANPLMRYDGYYVLSDAVGMPNLRAEADQRVKRLAAQWLFGVKPTSSDLSWQRNLGLTLYGVAAAVYKTSLVFGISLVIAQRIPLAGIGLAAAYVFQSLKGSALTLLNYLRFSEDLNGRRRRAVSVTAAAVVAMGLAVGLAPMPAGVDALAVAARLEERPLRVQTPGFVREILVEDGDRVTAEQPLYRLENIDVESEVQKLAVLTESLEVRWRQALLKNRQAAARAEARLRQAQEDYRTALRDQSRLEIQSEREATVTTVVADQLGAFLREGDVVATVGSGPWTLRALLTTEQIVDSQIQPGETVQFRLIGRPDMVQTGRVIRVTSQGQRKVEHAELTHLAGGEIAVDPGSSESTAPLFEVTITIDDDSARDLRSGSTAQVRFRSERTTLLKYLCRRGLQLINDLRSIG